MNVPYPDLDSVLTTFVGEVREVLGETFVGAYLQGSFALGAGDETSDCDFIVATTEAPRGSRRRGRAASTSRSPSRRTSRV